MTLKESTSSTGTDCAGRKRWFSVKAKDRSAQWFLFAFDEDDVARLTGYPRDGLRIEPAEWNGEEFVINER